MFYQILGKSFEVTENIEKLKFGGILTYLLPKVYLLTKSWKKYLEQNFKNLVKSGKFRKLCSLKI